MKKYLLPKDGNFYKANLHCHSTCSDGRHTPEELKEAYKKEGYSVVAFTDHEVYVEHSDLNDEGFLTINSYEASIADREATNDRYCRCYHFNCYDKHPSKEKNVVEPKPEYSDAEGINDYIARLNAAGFLVCYNHPDWSIQNLDDYRFLKGVFAMEIYNFSAAVEGIDGNQFVAYDDMLRGGSRLFCVATDDNHNVHPFDDPMNDSFGGFIRIKAPRLEYGAIINALEKGEFYASMGPEITELYVENGKLHVECSAARRIIMSTCGRRCDTVRAGRDGSVTQADFAIQPDDGYVRIQIEDREGMRANSNAYFIDEIL